MKIELNLDIKKLFLKADKALIEMDNQFQAFIIFALFVILVLASCFGIVIFFIFHPYFLFILIPILLFGLFCCVKNFWTEFQKVK